MRKKFIQLTSGWIPVSVLLLFAVALVTAQARGDLPIEVEPVHQPVTISLLKVVLSR